MVRPFFSLVSCVRHLSIEGDPQVALPSHLSRGGTRLSAYVPIRIPTQELWPLFGVVEQNVFVPALRDEPKLKVTAVASMFRRSPPSAWRVWAEARSAVVRLSSREAIGAHEDTVNLQDDRVLQLK